MMTPNPYRRAAGLLASGHCTPKTCRQCQRPYLGTNKQRYCSRRCKEAAERTKKTPACKWCGQPIVQAKTGRAKLYCSPTCKRRQLEGVSRQKVRSLRRCEQCSKVFRITGRRGWRRVYCSDNCRHRHDTEQKYLAAHPEIAVAQIQGRLSRDQTTDRAD